MKKLFLYLWAIGFLFFTTSNAMAAVITFDDVIGANPNTDYNDIYDGYGGFNWDNVYFYMKASAREQAMKEVLSQVNGLHTTHGTTLQRSMTTCSISMGRISLQHGMHQTP